jgi:hypothetical protein
MRYELISLRIVLNRRQDLFSKKIALRGMGRLGWIRPD